MAKNSCSPIQIGNSGSGRTNLLRNLINHQLDIDRTYLYAKEPYEAKHKYPNSALARLFYIPQIFPKGGAS